MDQDLVSWSELIVLDNASIEGFITTAANVFQSEGLVNQRQLDEIRVTLNMVHGKGDTRGSSTIKELLSYPTSIFDFHINYFGVSGFSKNITRFTTGKIILDIRHTIAELCRNILATTQMLFNRTVQVFDESDRLQTEALWSSLLLEVCDQLHILGEGLEPLLDLNKTLKGCAADKRASQTEFENMDKKLAESLGFLNVDDSPCSEVRERLVHKEFAFKLKALMATLKFFTLKLQHCVPRTDVLDIEQNFQFLNFNIDQLELLGAAHSEDLITNENQRQQYKLVLSRALKSLQNLQKKLEISLRSLVKQEFKHPNVLIREDTKRRLRLELLMSGIPPQSAEASVKKLEDYCKQKSIRPEHIIESELPRIDENLSTKTLKNFRDLAKTPPSVALDANKKARDYRRFERLSATIGQALVCLALVLFGSIGLNGCGVKTAPKSDIDDIRPAIPFRLERSETENINIDHVKPESKMVPNKALNNKRNSTELRSE